MQHNRTLLSALRLLIVVLFCTLPMVMAQTAPAPGSTILAQYLYASGLATSQTQGMIAGYRIGADGTLTSTGQLFPIANAARMVPSAFGRKLFALQHDRLVSFAVDPATGRLSLLQVLRFPERQTGINLGINPQSNLLFVLKQILDTPTGTNRITTYRISPAGILTPVASIVVPGLYSVDQVNPIAVDPTGRFIYVNTFSSNTYSITQLSIAQNTGALTVVRSLAVPDAGMVTNLVIHPSGRFLYQGASPPQVFVFSVDAASGSLTRIQNIICGCDLGPDFGGVITLTPQRNILFENVSQDNGLATFTIDPSTGKLTPQTFFPTDTRVFVIDGTGRFLYTTGPNEATIDTNVIGDSGTLLTPLGSVPLPPDLLASPNLRVVTVRQ